MRGWAPVESAATGELAAATAELRGADDDGADTGDFVAPLTGVVTCVAGLAATAGFALAGGLIACLAVTSGVLSGFAAGDDAVGGLDVVFAAAAAAASLAASADGSGLVAGGGISTAGGFALGDTANGSKRTGGSELTCGAVAGGLADAAGAEDGRGGAGDEGVAGGAALGFARGTRPEARRAESEEGGPDGRGAVTPGAAGGEDDAGRGGTDTADGAEAGAEARGLDDATVMAGDVRGSEPKMSSSSPQPESTFCSSFLSRTAGAGVLTRGAALEATGDGSQAESTVSLSAGLSGGDSASFMSASGGDTVRNHAMVRRAGPL